MSPWSIDPPQVRGQDVEFAAVLRHRAPRDLDPFGRNLLNQLTATNEVSSVFSKQGYKVFGISTGYYGARLKNVNIELPLQSTWNEYESSLIYNTPYPVLRALVNAKSEENRVSLHRRRILDAFSGIIDVSKVKGPKFVFVHIMSPHPPFVFDKEGKPVGDNHSSLAFDGSHLVGHELSRKMYRELYAEQARFISSKTLEIVKSVLDDSDRKSVVIIQGDHGPGSELDWENMEHTNLKERFSILNAYYFPDGGDVLLYDEISPVNSFRILFNYYFGASYELLPDESYFSTWSKPYDLKEVEATLR